MITAYSCGEATMSSPVMMYFRAQTPGCDFAIVLKSSAVATGMCTQRRDFFKNDTTSGLIFFAGTAAIRSLDEKTLLGFPIDFKNCCRCVALIGRSPRINIILLNRLILFN